MYSVRIAVMVVCGVMVATMPGAGQSPAPTQAPPQTAVLLGRVVDADSGDPVTEVTVAVASRQAAAAAAAAGARAGGAGGVVRVLTGPDGRFVVRDVPIGAVQLSVTAPGYVPSGQPFSITPGTKVAEVTLRAQRTAAITGLVLDERGEPRPGISVRAMMRRFVQGQPRFSFQAIGAAVQSDDRGVYRISGLAPGDYVVVTPQTQMAMPAALLENAMTGAATGDLQAVMALGLDFATSGGAMLNAGVRMGDLMVGTMDGMMPIPLTDGRLAVYPTRYYPGVDVPSQATVITLGSGEERSGVDLALRLAPTVSISGIVVGPNGPAGNIGVRLQHLNEPLTSEATVDVAAATTRADGTFMMPAVPEGQYVLRVLRAARPGPSAAQLAELPEEMKAMLGMLNRPGNNDETTVFAAQAISVERDLAGVTLTLSPGATVSGRVQFEGTSDRPAPGALLIALTPIASEWSGSPAMGMAGLQGRVGEDGTFTTTAYPPGRYGVSANVGGAAHWSLKSILINGREVAYGAFDLDGRDVTNAVVTFTDRRTTLNGTVQAPSAAPETPATVVVFPAAWREWISGGMPAQLARTTRTQANGSFTIAGLPARDYLVLAIDDSDGSGGQGAPNLQDPRVIEGLAQVATTLRLGEGETQTMSLKTVQVRR